MVIHDHLLTMSERPSIPVKIAELKARLSEYLRQVRAGRELVVYDRNQPIARVVPLESRQPLAVREPAARYGSLARIPLPPPAGLTIDVVDLLLEDRRER